MKIIWEFHHNGYVWLEWIDNGITSMKRFSVEAFDKFMEKQGELDFLD